MFGTHNFINVYYFKLVCNNLIKILEELIMNITSCNNADESLA